MGRKRKTQQITLGETPWVDDIFDVYGEAIYNAAPHPDWYPLEATDDGLPEYGCGSFGCVLPTRDDHVVIKVTQDSSEALFAAGCIAYDKWFPGMTKYHKVVSLPNGIHYVLWRDEIRDAGWARRHPVIDHNLGVYVYTSTPVFIAIKELAQYYPDLMGEILDDATRLFYEGAFDYELNELQEADRLGVTERGTIFTAGHCVYDDGLELDSYAIEDLVGDPEATAYLVGCSLAVSNIIAGYMRESFSLDGAPATNQSMLGECLFQYIASGVLITDVHAMNIGFSTTTNEAVIFDPGNVVPLSPEWGEVEVERIW